MGRSKNFLSDNEMKIVAPLFEHNGYIIATCKSPWNCEKKFSYDIVSDFDMRLLFGYNYESERVKNSAVKKLIEYGYVEYSKTVEANGETIKPESFRKHFNIATDEGKEFWKRHKPHYDELVQKQKKRQQRLGVGTKCIIAAPAMVGGIHVNSLKHCIVCEYVYVEKDIKKKNALKLLHYVDPNVSGVAYNDVELDGRKDSIIWVTHAKPSSRYPVNNSITIRSVTDEDIIELRTSTTIRNRLYADALMMEYTAETSRRNYYEDKKKALEDEINRLRDEINNIENRQRATHNPTKTKHSVSGQL